MDDLEFSTHLDLILATSEIGIWELDAKTGIAVRNLRHDQIFGHETRLSEWSADTFLTYVEPNDRDRVKQLLETSLQTGEPWSFETRILRADGAERWISAKGMPKLSDTGQVVKLIGHVIDITETKSNEDRLKLLSRELNHRVANTFAIMNSMVRHASKKATTVDDFAATLLERLASLARANKVLVAAEAERSSLSDILSMELKAFDGWNERIQITGNAHIWFSGEASEALAMILHELLTNAVKHGALSVPEGEIALSITRGEGRQVLIRWVERGGPPVVNTRPKGIGSTILQNAMRDEGKVDLDFAKQGLVCDITVNHSFERKHTDAGSADEAQPQEDFSDTPTTGDSSCAGSKIMIVEDDPIIGMDIAEIFRSCGAEVLGPFTTVASALLALQRTPDVALLDVNLRLETTDVIASQLAENEVPFLVLSGQADPSDLPSAFVGVEIVSKPFDDSDLLDRVLWLLREKRVVAPPS
ncbi:HWE histidine kinase domain-containing protein [Thioclava nitratireducens]|uniref:HWE histidine kinase domain-containing protein n=1 Tax=Thioclava nitratireducens TaxID=1915078 RepID=UPI002480DED1|nr:HWE histidine kinase domain-containing protein [Thioclava nitratireducens]WGT50415.1 HWE histidine kinase domain-containing protein [Thioclava nitratireducens]